MNSVSNFPWAFQFFGQATVAGTSIPVSVVVFLVLAVFFSLARCDVRPSAEDFTHLVIAKLLRSSQR